MENIHIYLTQILYLKSWKQLILETSCSFLFYKRENKVQKCPETAEPAPGAGIRTEI